MTAISTQLAHGIKATTTTAGTGSVTLAPLASFMLPLARFSVGSLMSYSIQDGNNREWGIGTVQAGDVLDRTTITGTLVAGTYTQGGAALNLSGGQSIVECSEHEGSSLSGVSEFYANFAAFPATGEALKIYAALDTGILYRWTGSAYVAMTFGITTTPSGGVAIAGPDGTKYGLNDKVITVGVHGMYTTLQAAIDSITTAQCFEELTGADLTGYPTTCNSWAQGFSQMGTSTSNPFSVLRYREGRMWVRADLDTRMYPVEAISGSSASDKIYLRHNRFEADISTPQALHVYEEHPVTILMLDDADPGCTFTQPVSIIIEAAAECKIGTLSFGAVECGSVELRNGAVINYLDSAAAGAAALTAAMWLLKFSQGGSLHTVTADGLELWNFGTVIIDDTSMLQDAYHGLSHYFLGSLFGDLLIKDMRYEVICLDSAAPVYPQFSSFVGRNLIVDGVKVLLRDPGSKVAALALFNFKDNFIWARYSVSNVSFQSQFANSVCVCAVIDEDLTLSGSAITDGATMYLTGISFDPANFSSAAKRKAYKTTTGGSNRNVVVSGLSNCSADKPSTGSLTVSDTRLGTQSTGAGSAALGANCPAVTPTAPNTWKAVTLADGSTGYIPVWK